MILEIIDEGQSELDAIGPNASCCFLMWIAAL
jgi:hypothetical protein